MEGQGELWKYLRFKLLDKNREIIRYHKPLSIWPGVKEGLRELRNIVQWLNHDRAHLGFWRDNWAANRSFKELLQL